MPAGTRVPPGLPACRKAGMAGHRQAGKAIQLAKPGQRLSEHVTALRNLEGGLQEVGGARWVDCLRDRAGTFCCPCTCACLLPKTRRRRAGPRGRPPLCGAAPLQTPAAAWARRRSPASAARVGRRFGQDSNCCSWVQAVQACENGKSARQWAWGASAQQSGMSGLARRRARL